MHNFVPSERFGSWLLNLIGEALSALGLHHTIETQHIIYLVAVLAIALLLGRILQKIVETLARRVIAVRFPALFQEFNQERVFSRSARVIPPLVLLSLIPFAFVKDTRVTNAIIDITVVWSLVTAVIAINAFLGFVWIHFNTHRNTKGLPLKGLLGLARGSMWVIAAILTISLFVGKSPIALLTGLGAFAAVLMLVFKDSILGVVAGVQLSQNDMLRVGDWISVPGTDANGIVIDVSLMVVKVRNWNNTVSMIPPFSLVSSHFVNWRYMKDSGSRQIEMSVYIDINTVRPLSDDELHEIQNKLPLLSDFINVKLQQRAEGKTANVLNKEAGANGTIDTNLGLLRAYLYLYVRQHPYVYTDRMTMIRILQPTPTGFPMQVFAYLTTSDWADYEGIQADIFEHIAAIAPTFSLSLYEEPSGRSVYNIGQNPQQGAPYYGNSPVHTAMPNPSTNHF